jgi:hypothetical protein
MPPLFKIGSRVRYRWGHRDTGTITGRVRCSVFCWSVCWDHDPQGPRGVAYEENLELIDSKIAEAPVSMPQENVPWETTESKA